MIGTRFHLVDGLFFIRTINGIIIEKTIPDKSTGKDIVEWSTEVTLEGFASVIASMSLVGETYETWQAALNELKRPTTILKPQD